MDIQTAVPQVICLRSGGRARCDTQREYLCLVSTEGLCSPTAPRALNDTGWQLACQIAEQPYVRQIVPTWYE